MPIQLRADSATPQTSASDSKIKTNGLESETMPEKAKTAASALPVHSHSMTDSDDNEQHQHHDDEQQVIDFVMPTVALTQPVATLVEQSSELQQAKPISFQQNLLAYSFKAQGLEPQLDELPTETVQSIQSALELSSDIDEQSVLSINQLAITKTVTSSNNDASGLASSVVSDELPEQLPSTLLGQVSKDTVTEASKHNLAAASELLFSKPEQLKQPLTDLPMGGISRQNSVQSESLAKRLLPEQLILNAPKTADINIKTADLNASLTAPLLNTTELESIKASAHSLLSLDSKDSLTTKAAPSLFNQADNQVNSFQWRKEQLNGTSSEWGQRLLHVLSDKVNLQIGQQIQRAQIRLDPPQLGSIDISISIEGDKTSVQLVASNAQVREAMQQTLEQLRQSLSQDEQVAVNVDIHDKQPQADDPQQDTESAITNNLHVEEGDTVLTEQQNSEKDWLNRLV
ncbi:flagellar hook-length control protein FliK [Pseudoalteromonas mariniglutinosa]|uniref:flagellar hook-length control protein FliK n=1 Tax=Pseudoalteromonas mariniglutinosa TaxID=206042 RepID=UPI00384DB0A1